jgi:hypothetical protein
MGLSFNRFPTKSCTFIYAYGLYDIRAVEVKSVDECVDMFIEKSLEAQDFEHEREWESRQREFILGLEWLEV